MFKEYFLYLISVLRTKISIVSETNLFDTLQRKETITKDRLHFLKFQTNNGIYQQYRQKQ